MASPANPMRSRITVRVTLYHQYTCGYSSVRDAIGLLLVIFFSETLSLVRGNSYTVISQQPRGVPNSRRCLACLEIYGNKKTEVSYCKTTEGYQLSESRSSAGTNSLTTPLHASHATFSRGKQSMSSPLSSPFKTRHPSSQLSPRDCVY